MRKNILAAVLIAACLVFPPGKSCAEDPSEVRLLNDLLGYIYSTEIICSDIQWVIDYFERFDREKNWENLQLARAALVIARADIEKTKLPKPEFTADDYKKFMKRKIDVSFMENFEYTFKAAQTTILNDCINLNNSVMFEVFLKDGWKRGMRSAANARKYADYELRSIANMADYALTSLNDSEITRKFNALLEKHCPQTRSRQRKKPESLKKIEEGMLVFEQELKEILTESSKIVGEAAHSFNIMNDAVEKKDWEAIRKNIMTISGMPPYVPLPSWLNNADVRYFWKKNDGVKIPPARTKLEGPPSECLMQVNGMSLENLKAWQDELKTLGLSPMWSGEKNSRYYIMYQVRNGKFNVVWENGRVNVMISENPVCFIPILYMSVMNNR